VPATAAKLDAVTFTLDGAARPNRTFKEALAEVSDAASTLA
jgi:hypothetical protein